MLNEFYEAWDYREIEGKEFLFLTSRGYTKVMVWDKDLNPYGLHESIGSFIRLYIKRGNELCLEEENNK